MRSNPLLLIQLHQFSVQLNNWSTRFGMTLTYDVAIEYYNNQYEVWEPVVEPWTLLANWNNTEGEDREIVVATQKLLNVNITKEFTKIMLATMEAISQDFSSLEYVHMCANNLFCRARSLTCTHSVSLAHDSTEGDQPTTTTTDAIAGVGPSTNLYYIRNDTGIVMWYKLSGQREAHRLLPGIEQPLELQAVTNTIKQVHRGSSAAATTSSSSSARSTTAASEFGQLWTMRQLETQQTMAVLLEGNYKTHSGLRINTSGVSRLYIDPRQNIASFDVGYRQGSKVIAIRSRVLIHNLSSENIDVQFALPHENGSGQQIESKPGLAPGATLAIPIMFAWNGQISFRPASSVQNPRYMFQANPFKMADIYAAISERQRNMASLSMLPSTMVNDSVISQDFIVARYLVVCPPNTARTQFFMMLTAETKHGGQDIVISMYSPIVMRNLLPFPCRLTFYDSRVRKACFQETLARGQVRFIHSARVVAFTRSHSLRVR